MAENIIEIKSTSPCVVFVDKNGRAIINHPRDISAFMVRNRLNNGFNIYQMTILQYVEKYHPSLLESEAITLKTETNTI
jgi:hypothetical protein